MSDEIESIAILGGTGDLGGGLARQWSRAGYKVLIGSRTLVKGKAAAQALLDEFPDLNVTGHENLDAATRADIVVLTVPFAHQVSTLETVKDALKGKILDAVGSPETKLRAALKGSSTLKSTEFCRMAGTTRDMKLSSTFILLFLNTFGKTR